jgi:nucleoid-associated protein YgaU
MSCRFRFALAVLALLAACNPAHAQDVPDDDANNPHIKAAQQDLDSNNPSGAADEYEAALAANPKLADAQYELGVIYAEKLAQPIDSIYHLERFLKLAPTSDHAPNARQIISQESDAFAASLPDASPTVVQVTRLQSENAGLKKQADDAARTITELQSQLAQAGAHRVTPADEVVPPVTPSGASAPVPSGTQRAVPLNATTATAAGAPAADAAAGGGRTYTVVKGDSIWKIAHKMYPGDTKNGVDKIQEANKDALGGKPLKIGQVLVIP